MDVRFRVLTAASMKMRAFWYIAPCSLGVDRRFRGAYCLHHQGDEWPQRTAFITTLMMKAVRTSETSVYSNDTTWCDILEGSHVLMEGRCSHPASSNLLTTPTEPPRFNSLHSHNGEKIYCWSTLPWRQMSEEFLPPRRLQTSGISHPDDGGSTHLWNVGLLWD
jgi:hypothetical protein